MQDATQAPETEEQPTQLIISDDTREALKSANESEDFTKPHAFVVIQNLPSGTKLIAGVCSTALAAGDMLAGEDDYFVPMQIDRQYTKNDVHTKYRLQPSGELKPLEG